MNLLMTGASGFIGSHILQALIENGHTVKACTHRKILKREPNVTQVNIDFMQMHSVEDWLPYLKDIDVVINCVGIIAETKNRSFNQMHSVAPRFLFEACEKLGIKKVIQISALGADKNAIVPYQLSKKSADDALRNKDLDWFVLRPSLVVGEGGLSYSLFQKLSNLPIILLLGDGEQMIQPVNISDIVAAVLRCLDDDVQAKRTIDLVGQNALSYKNWMLSLRTSKYPPRLFLAPMTLMMKLSKLGRFINLPLFNPDSLKMLQQNNVADRRGFTEFLGREALSLKQQKKNKEVIE